MEIIKVQPSSIKIKSKNISILINPDGKFDDEVIVLSEKPTKYSEYKNNLVIDGPGEFEVAGVSIKGYASDKGASFDFLEENQNVLYLSNIEIAKEKETEDYTAVIVKLQGEDDHELLTNIKSGIVVVYGDEQYLPKDQDTIKKIDKLNLKKIEEYKGFITYLSK